MGTAVSGSTLNHFASNAAANIGTSRNASSVTLSLSFSDLLRGQMYSGADTRTPEPPQLADTRPAPTPTPTPTPSPSSPETPRPSREGSTREPTHTNNQDSPSETGQPVKQRTETQENAPAAQQANNETGNSEEENNETGNNKEETTSGNAAPSKPPPQPQLADGTLSP
ncbi:MAG: hypothetical protein FWD51_04070, partial [Betaproteobacteria bacterium]|nr:hypothetical protein [Betaproteobacteria bacterium]